MKSSPKYQRAIRVGQFSLGSLLVFLVACLPAAAQLSPTEPDPLARIREAAKTNVQACSATGATLCEQVAPKIVANAEGDSPLDGNLRHLFEAAGDLTARTDGEPAAVTWTVASFRDANVDVHTEKYPLRPRPVVGPQEGEDVVAEVRGREKPDEWVLLGACLGSREAAYDAASVIEAARDIQLTGIHPRRSIRFVVFEPGGEFGSSHYVQAHRNELDRASAVIILSAGANPVTGFVLNGRHDIQPGVKEALDPIHAMGVTHHTFDAPLDRYSLFFLLEGIPTLLAPSPDTNSRQLATNWPKRVDPQELGELKRNTAIAAVMAFDIAERVEPLGPRLSRAGIESSLKTTGLEQSMKSHPYLWHLWESGQAGR
jgi:hypothetical protein